MCFVLVEIMVYETNFVPSIHAMILIKIYVLVDVSADEKYYTAENKWKKKEKSLFLLLMMIMIMVIISLTDFLDFPSSFVCNIMAEGFRFIYLAFQFS